MKFNDECENCGHVSNYGQCDHCHIDFCDVCPTIMNELGDQLCYSCHEAWVDSQDDEEPSGVDAGFDTTDWGTEDDDPNPAD